MQTIPSDSSVPSLGMHSHCMRADAGSGEPAAATCTAAAAACRQGAWVSPRCSACGASSSGNNACSGGAAWSGNGGGPPTADPGQEGGAGGSGTHGGCSGCSSGAARRAGLGGAACGGEQAGCCRWRQARLGAQAQRPTLMWGWHGGGPLRHQRRHLPPPAASAARFTSHISIRNPCDPFSRVSFA